MSRVFITGSADGLGLLAAKQMIDAGHRVVMHARNGKRADDIRKAVAGAEAVVVGDLSSIEETREVAQQVNKLGDFTAVIHNAGVGYREPRRVATVDKLPVVFAVNTLAPYILTALINKPQRLIYLSSGLHRGGDETLQDLTWSQRPWQGAAAYSDTKLHDTILAFAIARRWKRVLSNALEPGWVATKMGGADAPDDLEEGAKTQAWLATSDDLAARVTGGYFFHMKPRASHPAASKVEVQDKLLAECERLSGVKLPD